MNKKLGLGIGILIVIAAVVVALALAGGHSGENSTHTTRPSMNNMDMGNSATNSEPVATDHVTIVNFAFTPAHITVKKGTTVTWTNKDSAAHTVTEDHGGTADGDPGLESKGLTQGESYSAAFNKAGTFTYHCSIHPGMTGTVTVTER